VELGGGEFPSEWVEEQWAPLGKGRAKGGERGGPGRWPSKRRDVWKWDGGAEGERVWI